MVSVHFPGMAWLHFRGHVVHCLRMQGRVYVNCMRVGNPCVRLFVHELHGQTVYMEPYTFMDACTRGHLLSMTDGPKCKCSLKKKKKCK